MRRVRCTGEGKIVHERGALAAFLKEECHPGSSVAVETVGNRLQSNTVAA